MSEVRCQNVNKVLKIINKYIYLPGKYLIGPGPLLSLEVLGTTMLSSAMFEKKRSGKRGSGLVIKWSGDTSPAVNGAKQKR